MYLARHYWEVFHARVVRDSEGVEQDETVRGLCSGSAIVSQVGNTHSAFSTLSLRSTQVLIASTFPWLWLVLVISKVSQMVRRRSAQWEVRTTFHPHTVPRHDER